MTGAPRDADLPMRRVIIGQINGKSAVIHDEPISWVHHVKRAQVGALEAVIAPALRDPAPEGESLAADIWETTDRGGPFRDRTRDPRPIQIEPPGEGVRIRYTVWGPNLDSSSFHATDTLDVNFILRGEVELLLEQGSTILRTNDWIIIPGGEHGWRAGPEGVTMITFMMIDINAQPAD